MRILFAIRSRPMPLHPPKYAPTLHSALKVENPVINKCLLFRFFGSFLLCFHPFNSKSVNSLLIVHFFGFYPPYGTRLQIAFKHKIWKIASLNSNKGKSVKKTLNTCDLSPTEQRSFETVDKLQGGGCQLERVHAQTLRPAKVPKVLGNTKNI